MTPKHTSEQGYLARLINKVLPALRSRTMFAHAHWCDNEKDHYANAALHLALDEQYDFMAHCVGMGAVLGLCEAEMAMIFWRSICKVHTFPSKVHIKISKRLAKQDIDMAFKTCSKFYNDPNNDF